MQKNNAQLKADIQLKVIARLRDLCNYNAVKKHYNDNAMDFMRVSLDRAMEPIMELKEQSFILERDKFADAVKNGGPDEKARIEFLDMFCQFLPKSAYLDVLSAVTLFNNPKGAVEMLKAVNVISLIAEGRKKDEFQRDKNAEKRIMHLYSLMQLDFLEKEFISDPMKNINAILIKAMSNVDERCCPLRPATDENDTISIFSLLTAEATVAAIDRFLDRVRTIEQSSRA